MACACGLPGASLFACCPADRPSHVSNQVAASRVVIEFDVFLGLEFHL